MQKIDFYGLALLLSAVRITLMPHSSITLTRQEQTNTASLSVLESYCECHDIFHRNSTAPCSSANMTEGLLCAKCRGRSWRYQSVSHSILAHKSLQPDSSQIIASQS